MTNRVVARANYAAWLVLPAVLATLLAGCAGDGLSDYDRIQQERQAAADTLKQGGAKLEEKKYPQGDAWSVDLTNYTITDETFAQLRSLGPITELFFQGSNLSDAHAESLNAMEVSGFLLKLDVSQTQFSDAGLAKLTGMNLLRELVVKGSQVTPQGLNQFQQSREQNPAIMQAFRRVKVVK